MRYARTLLLVMLLSACDDDPAAPVDSSIPAFMPLTSRSAVLNNVEVAWNQRRADKVDELLDANFTFFFAPRDVGGSIPASWDRPTEIASVSALLNSNTVPPASGPICTSVRVDLDLDDITWVEVPGPAAAVGEMSYTTTVFYSFTFEMEPDITFVAQNGAKAVFTVRQVGDEWRLVEWRDLGASMMNAIGSSAEAVPSSTWGSIKALYR